MTEGHNLRVEGAQAKHGPAGFAAMRDGFIRLSLPVRDRPLRTALETGTLTSAGGADARETLRSWASYESTPLVSLPVLATALGVHAVSCKDESARFGIGSFKALGGAFAVLRALQDEVERQTGHRPSASALRDGSPVVAEITIVTASAGNHGRSVAWGSELFGCRCVVVLPVDAIPPRAAAIESHGARVERFDGAYDEAVGWARSQAEQNGWLVVSDTAYDGYEDIPRRIMEGYTLLAEEMLDAIAAAEARPLTHLLIQGGVGGLAAGVCGRMVERLGDDRPRFVVVEPWKADCFGRSLRAGHLVTADPPFETEMGGLAAGVPSTIAWDFLETALDAAVALPESVWISGAAALGRGDLGPAIEAGPSGAAGVGALLVLAGLPASRSLLEFDEHSHVGVLVTEKRFT